MFLIALSAELDEAAMISTQEYIEITNDTAPSVIIPLGPVHPGNLIVVFIKSDKLLYVVRDTLSNMTAGDSQWCPFFTPGIVR